MAQCPDHISALRFSKFSQILDEWAVADPKYGGHFGEIVNDAIAGQS